MKSPLSLRGFQCLTLATFAIACADSLRAQTNAATPRLPASMLYPTNQALLPGKGPIPSWKPFPQLWARRRAEFLEHKAQDQGAVVFLGDSITQGWNDLSKQFPDMKIANRGIGGDTTRGVWFRLPEDVLDLDPKAIVLLIGTNDLGNNGDPEDSADNIRAIIHTLESSNPKMPIVLCHVMPSKAGVADRIKKLNALLDVSFKDDPRVTLCDTWTIYANPDGTCKKEEFPDLLHPNKVGYEKWAAALKPIFAKLNLEN